jgi:hypothetical protein
MPKGSARRRRSRQLKNRASFVSFVLFIGFGRSSSILLWIHSDDDLGLG